MTTNKKEISKIKYLNGKIKDYTLPAETKTETQIKPNESVSAINQEPVLHPLAKAALLIAICGLFIPFLLLWAYLYTLAFVLFLLSMIAFPILAVIARRRILKEPNKYKGKILAKALYLIPIILAGTVATIFLIGFIMLLIWGF